MPDRKLQQDPLYEKLLKAMTATVGQMINHNLLSGFDAQDTPDEVMEAIDSLKQVVCEIYNRECQRKKNSESAGLKSAFALYRAAKYQIFAQETKIKDLPSGSQQLLTEILRWHIEDALNNPHQYSRNK